MTTGRLFPAGRGGGCCSRHGAMKNATRIRDKIQTRAQLDPGPGPGSQAVSIASMQ